jgi:flagellar basal-body rod protein FlgF
VIRGLYTAAAGALVAQADADNIANNLANVSTTGFKSTLLQVQSNEPMAISRQQNGPGGSSSVAVGDLGSGSQVVDTPTSYGQGGLQHTGNPLDLAISGDAFFTVQTPQGLRYTRDGSFMRNGQGLMVTSDGNLVLGQNGQAITLPDGPVNISQDGTIKVGDDTVNQLQLTSFSKLNNLGKEGSNLFYDAGANPQPTTTGSSLVTQGSLEGSNANVVRSMVDLITAQRWFEANEKCISTEDTATAQALQTVGNSKG